jgi:hypothetical protein
MAVRLRILAGVMMVGLVAGCGSTSASTSANGRVALASVTTMGPVSTGVVSTTLVTSAPTTVASPSAAAPTTAESTVPPTTAKAVPQPLPTAAPVTQPRVTQPPVTHPPVTQPPATQPPVTQPPVTQPPAPVASCHPLSNSGTCYRPGEFCRNSDHGVSGVAGNGENITCRDNNGWRWEPS